MRMFNMKFFARIAKVKIAVGTVGFALLMFPIGVRGYTPPSQSLGPAVPIDTGAAPQVKSGTLQLCASENAGCGVTVNSSTPVLGIFGQGVLWGIRSLLGTLPVLTVTPTTVAAGRVSFGGATIAVPTVTSLPSSAPEGALVFDESRGILAFFTTTTMAGAENPWRYAEQLSFIKPDMTRRLTLQISGEGKVAVFRHRQGVDRGNGGYCRDSCTMRYTLGDSVRLYAVPDSGGSAFTWGGACASASNKSCELEMNVSRSVTVTFR